MNFIKKTSLLALLAMTVMACNKDAETQEFEKGNGKLNIEFKNVFGNQDLAINSEYDEQGGKATISRLSYITSNFILVDDKGKEFVYPKDSCYFLIDEKAKMTHFELKNIPAGNYTHLKFGVGLDETMNEKGKGNIKNLGDLLLRTEDHKAMWSWQGTPIIMMLEGTFKSNSDEGAEKFLLHIGNTTDAFHYQVVNLKSNEMIQVRKDKKASIRIKADVEKMVNGNDERHKVNLAEHPYITVNPEKAKMLYTNVLTMFQIEQ